MNRQSPRILDVARAAGVSTATVSRALSKPEVVSGATLEAVLKAVHETGYIVNHAARNLRQQRTGGIVALVPNLANPFFSRILSGIASVLAPAGYGLLVADTSEPGAEARILRTLDRSRADGLIVFDGRLPPEDLSPGRRGAPLPPVILACEWIDALTLPTIRVDNAEGARLAVAHLAALGHRAIGHVLGPEGNVLTDARAQGARAALGERGLVQREDWFFRGDFSLESGARPASAGCRSPNGRRPSSAPATRWPAASSAPSSAAACGCRPTSRSSASTTSSSSPTSPRRSPRSASRAARSARRRRGGCSRSSPAPRTTAPSCCRSS
jgi:LacI family transcriptional regulator, repressor for deo operon, udp, cdd, tsx, nupC, and nupG